MDRISAERAPAYLVARPYPWARLGWISERIAASGRRRACSTLRAAHADIEPATRAGHRVGCPPPHCGARLSSKDGLRSRLCAKTDPAHSNHRLGSTGSRAAADDLDVNR